MNSRNWKLGALVILVAACSPKTHPSAVGQSPAATTTQATLGPTGGASSASLAVSNLARPKASPAGHAVPAGAKVRHPAAVRPIHKAAKPLAKPARPAAVAASSPRPAATERPSLHTTPPAGATSADAGNKLYHTAGATGTGCAACHGPNGTGIGGIVLHGKTAADIAKAMTMQPMASMGFHLSPRDEANLAAYLATLG